MTASYCPDCNVPMQYRDSCKRIWRLEGGERRTVQIFRMKCPKCKKLHRALPDFLAPFKHYGTSVISRVIDGKLTPDNLSCEDYPTAQTMISWILWFELNKARIEGYLKLFGSALPGFTDELLYTGAGLLQKLRSSNRGGEWLEACLEFIYNNGGFLVPYTWLSLLSELKSVGLKSLKKACTDFFLNVRQIP